MATIETVKTDGFTMDYLKFGHGPNIFVMIPLVFIIGFCTDLGPVFLYLGVKLIDFIKVIVFHLWLKKERWLKNLTV